MRRPDFVTPEDIARWSDNIDKDEKLPKSLVDLAIIREVCYCGLWLAEELDKLKCPPEIIVRIQWTAGKLSFGRDMWEIHLQMLEDYKVNKLIFEDSIELQN